MLNWSEEFTTGVKLVDLQHQNLIENINNLEKLLNESLPTRASCDQLINFLVKYVNTHFRFEELCMESHRCPAHAQNQREHVAFQAIVKDFSQKYQDTGPTRELLYNLHKAACKWIVHHILTVDWISGRRHSVDSATLMRAAQLGWSWRPDSRGETPKFRISRWSDGTHYYVRTPGGDPVVFRGKEKFVTYDTAFRAATR